MESKMFFFCWLCWSLACYNLGCVYFLPCRITIKSPFERLCSTCSKHRRSKAKQVWFIDQVWWWCLLVLWNLQFTKIGCKLSLNTSLTAYSFDAKVATVIETQDVFDLAYGAMFGILWPGWITVSEDSLLQWYTSGHASDFSQGVGGILMEGFPLRHETQKRGQAWKRRFPCLNHFQLQVVTFGVCKCYSLQFGLFYLESILIVLLFKGSKVVNFGDYSKMKSSFEIPSLKPT